MSDAIVSRCTKKQDCSKVEHGKKPQQYFFTVVKALRWPEQCHILDVLGSQGISKLGVYIFSKLLVKNQIKSFCSFSYI